MNIKNQIIQIYKEVLDGSRKKFPNGFWGQPKNKDYANYCVEYLINNILKWNDEDIKAKFNGNVLIKNKLSGMLQTVFDSSPYNCINNLYPDKFKPWEMKMTSINYWNKENAINATKWMIEEKLKWNDEDIKHKLCQKIFKDNNLFGMLDAIYDKSPYDCINETYPDKFKPWEFISTSQGYWTKETGKIATKWMIEEKLKWNDEDIKNKLCQKTFKDNGLIGMLQIVYNYIIYDCINDLYPNKFKPWEFNSVPQYYWNDETIKKALKWLVYDKLKIELKDLTINDISNNGLIGIRNFYNLKQIKQMKI